MENQVRAVVGSAEDMRRASSIQARRYRQPVSFLAVDIFHMAQSDTEFLRNMIRGTLDLVVKDHRNCPSPIHVYPITKVEEGFRFLQSGKLTGRIVFEVNDASPVSQRLLQQSAWKFDPHASYIVAGGLGGLGHGIVHWMAKKGAKHLILLSRSGAESRAAMKTLKGLQGEGVNVAAPRCDVSLANSLSEALDDCARMDMPPIKGCISAVMVLQDAISIT